MHLENDAFFSYLDIILKLYARLILYKLSNRQNFETKINEL